MSVKANVANGQFPPAKIKDNFNKSDLCVESRVRGGFMSETWVIAEETMFSWTVIIFETAYWW